MERWVLTYEEAAAAGPEVAGGKGYNLGRLAAFGFPVPPGVVIAAGAYQAFLERNGLVARVEALGRVTATQATDPEVVAELEGLQAAIRGGELPPGLAEELAAALEAVGIHRSPLAVRSSAAAEDSSRTSFAGIHRSFLNVRGLPDVLEKVRACYASLWTPQALAYRRRLGVRDADAALAVVVCALVPAVASGVAFSADPVTGRRDRVVIAAGFGLGESVVMGTGEVDQYVVAVTNTSPARVLDVTRGQKRHRVLPAEGGGTRLDPLGEAERVAPVLERPQVEKLALLVLRVQDALGDGHVPQDVEWCWDGFQFVLTQARPVTAIPWPTFPELSGQPLIWSNANLKDAYPGVQSPLGWWLNAATHEIMARHLLAAGGYPVPEGMTWSRLYQGRMYLNLSAIQWALWDAFGLRPEATNRALGGHQPTISLPPEPPGKGRERLRRLMRLGWAMRRAEARAPRLFQEVREWMEAEAAQDLDRLEDRELVRKLWELETRRRELLPEAMIHNVNSQWSGRLAEFLEREFPGRGEALTAALLSGSGGVVSAEPGYRLVAIARVAAREPQARDYFLEEPLDVRAWRERLLGTRTLERLEQFLRDFGFRAVYEMEIQNPRWVEDPTYILQVVASHLRAGEIPEDPRAPARERRRQAEREVARRLLWRPHRYLFYRFLLAKARQGMRLREGAKEALVRLLWPMRRWALAAGRRLVRRGLLREAGEVFLLTGNEIVALLTREWDGAGLGAILEHRRRLLAELERLEPPDVILDDRPQPRAAALLQGEPAGAGQGTGALPAGAVLAGLGVAAGVASGRARILRHPGEGSRLGPGEVLVAPSTDPAWTPLFLRAAAVVTEVGGFLSHGAIVAREYGIPAVVNAAGATRVLREGERIRVDGDRGLIFREGAGDGATGARARG